LLNRVLGAATFLLLGGCAYHPELYSLDADSPDNARREIIRQDEAVSSFEAKAFFDFDSPQGRIQLKGSVALYGDDNGRVEINGPWGMALAVININHEQCLVELPQLGQTLIVPPDQPIVIPSLNFLLPSPSEIAIFLKPTIHLHYCEDWIIQDGKAGANGWLRLTHKDENPKRELLLMLTSHPVRVHSEKLTVNGKTIYERQFGGEYWRGYLPKRLSVTLSNLTLNIKYSSIRVNRIKPNTRQTAEAS